MAQSVTTNEDFDLVLGYANYGVYFRDTAHVYLWRGDRCDIYTGLRPDEKSAIMARVLNDNHIHNVPMFDVKSRFFLTFGAMASPGASSPGASPSQLKLL